jgi:hypothetical protein
LKRPRAEAREGPTAEVLRTREGEGGAPLRKGELPKATRRAEPARSQKGREARKPSDRTGRCRAKPTARRRSRRAPGAGCDREAQRRQQLAEPIAKRQRDRQARRRPFIGQDFAEDPAAVRQSKPSRRRRRESSINPYGKRRISGINAYGPLLGRAINRGEAREGELLCNCHYRACDYVQLW